MRTVTDTEVQTPLTMKHRLVWDIMPYHEVPEAFGKLDLVRPGPDVASMEETESKVRLSRIAHLVPQIIFLAGISSSITSTAMLEEHESLTESEKDMIREMIYKASVGSAVATVANMADLELIRMV